MIEKQKKKKKEKKKKKKGKGRGGQLGKGGRSVALLERE